MSELEGLLEAIAQCLLSGDENIETQEGLKLSQSITADRAELVRALVSQDFS